MKRRTLLARAAAFATAPAIVRAADKSKIVWWHAMTAALGDQVNHAVEAFNQSQDAIEVTAIYKGGYADVLTATIAAFRAGQAPHLAQIFEVGTGTMLAAGRATKQVWELTKETGVAIDPKTYIPAVRGYYSLADGRMASMPHAIGGNWKLVFWRDRRAAVHGHEVVVGRLLSGQPIDDLGD